MTWKLWATVATAAAGGWFFWQVARDQDRDAPPQDQMSRAAITGSLEVDPEIRYVWRVGDRAAYDYTCTATTLRGSAGALPGSFRMKADLLTQVLSVRPDEVVVGYQFRVHELAVDNASLDGLIRLLEGKVFLMRLAGDGRLQEQLLPEGLSAFEHQFLLTHPAYQVTLPARRGDAWTIEETSGNYGYLAHYAATDGVIVKTVSNFREHNTHAAPAVLNEFRAEARVSRVGLENYVELCALEYLMPEGNSAVVIQQNLVVSRKQVPDDPVLALWVFVPAEELDVLIRHAYGEHPFWRARQEKTQNEWNEFTERELQKEFGPISFAAIYAEVLAAITDHPDRQEQLPWIRRMSQWLSVHPEEAVLIVDSLAADADLDTDRISALMLAMVGAATRPEVQRALAQALTRVDLPPDARLQAAVSAGDVGGVLLGPGERFAVVSPELVDALFAQVADLSEAGTEGQIASTALLAAGRLAEVDESVEARLEAWALALLEDVRPRSANEIISLIYSLENMGRSDPVLRDHILPLYAPAQDERVRAAALRYLVMGNSNDPRWVQQALYDRDPAVRNEALTLIVNYKVVDASIIDGVMARISDAAETSYIAGRARDLLEQNPEVDPRINAFLSRLPPRPQKPPSVSRPSP